MSADKEQVAGTAAARRLGADEPLSDAELVALAAWTSATVAAMQAENQVRDSQGVAPAYGGGSFYAVNADLDAALRRRGVLK